VFEAAAKGDQDVTQGAGKQTAISATPATALPGSVAGGRERGIHRAVLAELRWL
jgi:hypothetical protein